MYGTDDRQDVYAHADATLRARAMQATVALMEPFSINATNPNNVTFNAPTLQADYNLCSTERFLNDPTPAFCSGTLIDDDLVLTAGHCITSASECASTRFVFKFYRPSATAIETITTNDIFTCTSIVARQQGVVNGRNLDYAIVRIDRPATPAFTPAPIRPGNTALTVGQAVAVIGSGSGIPFKIDSGGAVRDARPATLDYFVANTDTFGGNSGSGVYELQNHAVAGILVRGATDYVSNGSCNIVNVCSNTGCSGEGITYVRPAVDHFCMVASSTRLCGPPPNDYTLSLNPTTRNVTAGQSTTYTVQSAVTAGTGQSVALTITGLPAGVTGSFSPSTITAGGNSTLTLNVAGTVPSSTVNFNVTGTAGTVIRNTTGTAVITNTNALPTVSITSPANGAVISGANIAIAATAADSDGTVASVRFDLPDGTNVIDNAAPYTATWSSLTVADGPRVIKATATDNLGFTATHEITVNVQNGPSNCATGTYNATGLPLPIPDANPAGITSTIAVPGNGTVSALTFSVNITHTWRGDITLRLTSPSGTTFSIKEANINDNAPNVVITNQAIAAFANEPASGQWKLFVSDAFQQDTGTLVSWSLNVTANCAPPSDPWSAAGTPNIPLRDNGSVCSTLTVAGSGEASVAKLDIRGRHDHRGALRATLSHGGVTVEAFPKKTFPNTSGIFQFQNRAVSGFSGSATGEWTLCVIDTDGFGDTGILNSWGVHN